MRSATGVTPVLDGASSSSSYTGRASYVDSSVTGHLPRGSSPKYGRSSRLFGGTPHVEKGLGDLPGVLHLRHVAAVVKREQPCAANDASEPIADRGGHQRVLCT